MTFGCPNPHTDHDALLLGHGAGGRLTAELLDELVIPALGGRPARCWRTRRCCPVRATWS